MITICITPEMVEKATELSTRLGKLKNSIREGEGNICGFLGELAFAELFKESEHAQDYDYDFVYRSKKIEIKSKERTVRPKSFYEVSISNNNPNQQTGYYVFVSLYKPKDHYLEAHVLGYKSRAEFFKQATFIPKGTIDERNDFEFKTDTYNYRIDRLENIAHLAQPTVI